MAVFRIEKTRDYTVMSNHHLIRTGHGAHPVGNDEDGFVFYEPG